MKANRKSLNREDEAVSPVIAVILMVAITVVLAATVYVWVSGFGSNSNSSPAHTMSVVSAGAINAADTETVADDATPQMDTWTKTYTVSSASPTLTYGDMTLTVGGTQYTFTDPATTCNFPAEFTGDTADGYVWGACAGTTERLSTASVRAGDIITISCFDDDPLPADTIDTTRVNCLNDADLLFLDTESNSIMVSLKVR